jgi:hypothetical protein
MTIKKPRPCKRCKAEIPVERLEALPQTQICVKCSEAIGGEWDYHISNESIGKAGSLKKNYGGISVRKTRRRIKPLEE